MRFLVVAVGVVVVLVIIAGLDGAFNFLQGEQVVRQVVRERNTQRGNAREIR